MKLFRNKTSVVIAMKRFSIALMAAAFALAIAMPATALGQDDNSATAARPRKSPDEVVQMLGTKLNLTDDQKAQIKPIIEERRQKLQELHSENMRPMKKKREAKAIISDSDKKINKILNDEQRKQYAEIEKQMREEMKERRSGGM